jgi:hypothetical protein
VASVAKKKLRATMERTQAKMQPRGLVVASKLTLLSQIRARFDLAFWEES